MIQPHRLPIDKPVVQDPIPAWFRDCFKDWPIYNTERGIQQTYAAYLRLNPDLRQNKKADFEIGAV